MTRIKMPDGHIQISLEGVTHNQDEEGCFDVAPRHVANLIAVHGAILAPSAQDIEARADIADANVIALEQQLKFARQQAKAAREQAAAAAKKHTAALDAAAKAATARAKAAKESDDQAAADAVADAARIAAIQVSVGSTGPAETGQSRVSIPRVPAA